MMNTVTIVFACAILLLMQQAATAINCYSCSAGTEGCGAKSFSKTGAGVLSTADSSATYCTKTTVSGNSNYASRSYVTSGSCSGTTTSTSAGNTVTVQCCSSDLCNSADMTGINFLLAIGAAVIGLYFTK